MTKNILKLFENYVSKNEINYQSLDSSRAINEFGFKASTSLNKGIDKTINWYKKFIK